MKQKIEKRNSQSIASDSERMADTKNMELKGMSCQ